VSFFTVRCVVARQMWLSTKRSRSSDATGSTVRAASLHRTTNEARSHIDDVTPLFFVFRPFSLRVQDAAQQTRCEGWLW
jgi:hypothetical protein